MKSKILQTILNESLTRFPDHNAIECGSRSMSYRELEKRSNHIANWVLRQGIKTQTCIGVLLGDKMDFILAVVGILKAGCIFMPLEPTYPEDRLELLIRATHTGYIISDRENASRLSGGRQRSAAIGSSPDPAAEMIRIEDLFVPEPGSWWTREPGISYSPEDKIYIYFTSGTTGIPRALLGKNKSLLHFIKWEIETFGIAEGFRVSQLTSPGFDAILRDIFAPLCTGGTVCCPETRDIIADPARLTQWIDRSDLQLIHCVPSLFRALNGSGLTAGHFKNLKYILLSGERLNPPDLVSWYDTFAGRIQLVNLWGTSETTLAKTVYFISREDAAKERIPVGKPIKGAMVVVLDQYLNICGEQVKGALYIRTPFRTCGYLNDPELTHERFIKNPFNRDPNDLLHVSGDMGTLLPDGNYDLIGRQDRQVKIRGIRIELEEIEAVLLRHPRVKEAVVIKTVTPGANEMLCAYVTAREPGDEESFTTDIIVYLEQKLPDYMIPAQVMRLEELPRKPSGKVDHSRLPDALARTVSQYLPPRNDVEKKIATLWSEILGIEKIGIDRHFFELGGNSLNIMTLLTRIHKAFEVRISLAVIFENLTIALQAKIIAQAKKETYTAIGVAEKKEYYPLSSAQKRLYFLYRLQPEDLSYNNLLLLDVEEADEKKLEQTFKQLLRRHESFRTSFLEVEGKSFQQVKEEVPFAITSWQAAAEEEVFPIIAAFKKPFDLSQPPLLRVGLIKNGRKPGVLLFDMHHIIGDGTSLGVVEREFKKLYRGEALAPLRIRYKDFCQWQNRAGTRDQIKRQEAYWLETFRQLPPPLDLPGDFPRPTLKSTRGAMMGFGLSKDLTHQLELLAEEEGATLFMVMLAITNVMLAGLSGQEDIIVGTGVAGRTHSDLQDVIGLLVNLLPLRNFPQKNKPFILFLREIRERTLNAFENQDYQFEELIEKLGLQRDPGRSPLFDVTFEIQNIDLEALAPQAPPTDTPVHSDENLQAKFDMSIIGQKINRELFFSIEYCPELFTRETLETYGEYFKDIVTTVLENKDIPLEQIKIRHGLSDGKLNNPQVNFNF
jgi:amino acid adenylation domain-containing protein